MNKKRFQGAMLLKVIGFMSLAHYNNKKIFFKSGHARGEKIAELFQSDLEKLHRLQRFSSKNLLLSQVTYYVE